MKKNSILLIISLLALNLNAQITISGSTTYPALNLTFNAVSSVPFTDCYITSTDAGTNAYKANVYVPATGGTPGYNIDYYISRRNNYWHIEGFNYLFSPHKYSVYYVSQSTSADINPPCGTIWQIFSGSCIPSGAPSTIASTGSTTSTLSLSGTCASIPVISTTICPNILLLPQQTTVQITAIVSPKKGMITFDVTANAIKVYNGVAWKTITMF